MVELQPEIRTIIPEGSGGAYGEDFGLAI